MYVRCDRTNCQKESDGQKQGEDHEAAAPVIDVSFLILIGSGIQGTVLIVNHNHRCGRWIHRRGSER